MAAIQTFNDLCQQILGWLDEVGNADTTLTNVQNALNQVQQLRLVDTRWPFLLWPTVETLSVTTATRFYTLHPMAHRLESVFDPTNKKFVKEIPLRGQASLQTPTTPQVAAYFRLNGVAPVAAQPASASVLTIVSSALGDNDAGKAITIKGIASGAYAEETITPAGTTPASGTTAFSQVLAVTKAAAWVGTMTLSAGSTTVLVLTANEFSRQYPVIEFLQVPQTNIDLQYRFYRQPLALSANNDIPDIPMPFSQVLVYDTLIQMLAAYNTDADQKALAVWRDFQQKWDTAMRQTYLEGQTVEAEPRRIRYTDEDPAAIRIFPLAN